MRAHRAQLHRGPDDDGVYESRDRSVTFLHRRLSILDLSPLGKQPMVHARAGHVICFNGEIYNYRALKDELVRLGASFRGHSDTEVVLEAYTRWGEGMLERLRGMFALAIHDAKTGRVLLARDRLGIKPLYYSFVSTAAGTTLVFASEVRALLASGLVRREIDPVALESFLWNGVVATPRTIVKGVSLLGEGEKLLVENDGRLVAHDRYWTFPRHRPLEGATAQTESVRRAKAVLEETVAQHIVSDVPLGVFLSGGIDSSALAALAAKASKGPVRTFNVSFDEARYDESPYAKAVAKAIGTEHVDVRLTEARFQAQLGDALAAIDQPTFDGVNSYFVSRAVREAGVTVALAGTGGDELFGGYSSFRDVPRARRFPTLDFLPTRLQRSLYRAAGELLSSDRSNVLDADEVRPQTRFGKLEDLAAARGGLYEAYQVSYSLFTRSFMQELAKSPPSDALDWGLPKERAEVLRGRIADEPDLMAISSLELGCFLGERLLRDTDWASMAVSLEVRVPLLDHVFVEALAEVPLERRYRPLGKKQLLRDLALSHLPPSLFEREKRGFELPLGLWIRRTLARELESTLTDVVLAHRIGLNGEAVARVYRAYRDGAKGLYWSRVWALYVLMQWCRTHGLELAR